MLKKIYQSFREKLPVPAQIRLSKLAVYAANKPIYDTTGKLPYDKGVVVFSADFELAWAWRFSKRGVDPLLMARREREHFPLILNKLNELQIPITWGTVGHLFLDSCECKNGKAHYDMPRPDYFENEFWRYSKGDWYDIDPCGNYKDNPEFYAPDLVEDILKSAVQHELGSHSFSHIDCSDKNAKPELVQAELEATTEAMKRFGITPVSFIYPGHTYGNFDAVKRAGYKVVRYKTNDNKEAGFPETLPNGLRAIHDSLSFDLHEQGWDHSFVLWKMKRYIDRAIKEKAVVHFWFHPSVPLNDIHGHFFPLLRYVSECREQGKLEVKMMQDFQSDSAEERA